MCYKSTVIKMLDVVIPCYNNNNKRFGHEWVQTFETVTCSRLHPLAANDIVSNALNKVQ